MQRRAIFVLICILALSGCRGLLEHLPGSETTAKTESRPAPKPDYNGVVVVRGDNPENQRRQALLKQGLTGLSGQEIGYYLDIQEARLRQEFSTTKVVLKRRGDTLNLIIPGASMFAFGSADLEPSFKPILDGIAAVLVEYDKTLLKVAGHTDSSGDATYNQQLSEQRALSVGRYLAARGVEPQRIIVIGHGETRPIADNDTPEGQANNRRVELTLTPILGVLTP
jgi:outer membrane protein OmpA-like peptidoglycan-associated protein